MNYVHNIPVKEILKPDVHLRNLLMQDNSHKWILTNSDRNHSTRVLEALGIRDQFEGIVDVWATDFKPKPAPHFFRTAMRMAGSSDPSSIMFFDDISQNVLGAKEFGFTSVYVGEGIIAEGIDHQIMTIHDFQKIKKEVLSSNE
jgi:putative hydrolase of the HAD superfamily